MTYQTVLEFSTAGRGTRDITRHIARVVTESGVSTGLVHVFVQHTSCSLLITENADPDVRADLETIIGRIAPDNDPAYRHRMEGPDDMAAHGRSVLTAAGLSVPVGAGRLMLGTWQGIFLWEHRIEPQQRTVVITVM